MQTPHYPKVLVSAFGLLGFLLLPIIAHGQLGSASGLSSEHSEFFEKQVRPLLVKRCFECHGGTKSSGGLSLALASGWKKGGDGGVAIVPGEPEKSLLIDAINYRSLEMPPVDKGGKLSADEIAIFTKWVAIGAPDPRDGSEVIGGMSREEARDWWAFQAPAQDSARQSDHLIDTLIRREWKDPGLTPTPRADKRTLIRRATYDLTGLPPTLAEIEAFVADDSPQSFKNVIERLLSSPQYGEHWGRHWLDVVRYADTAGENTDRPLPHAWRYRNWVFDAFNRDMRYDDFVRWQIAGDILCSDADEMQRRQGIIATGYLAIARRFGHDIDKDVHLMHEDVIDNLGKNFLGLTTGCARCHDHKYDPVTAEDYYALYGIFDSTRFAFPGCEPKGQPRDLVPLMNQAQIDSTTNQWQSRNAIVQAEKKRLAESIDAAAKNVSMHEGEAKRTLSASQVNEGASVTFAEGKRESLELIKVRTGEVIQLTVSPNESHGADSTLVEWTIVENGDAQRRWSIVDMIPSLLQGNPHDVNDEGRWCFLEVTSDPKFLYEKKDSINGNSALKAISIGSEPSVFVNSADQPVAVWTTLPAKSFFVHPGIKRPIAVAWISPIDGEISIAGRVADVHPSGSDGVAFQLDHFASAAVGPALISLSRTKSDTTVTEEPAPVFPVAYAVAEGTPRNAHLQLRGDPEKLGAEVPRRWLSIFGSTAVQENEGSGRKQLADWIVAQPITSRVMVNRIWQWHFGNGLVRSPNDFGSRGEKPTHLELLDWLASQFTASGYSVKAMHRLIMNSEAYQRASAAPSDSDTDNRLLMHFNRRRLTAEELRDSLLAASGKLDLSPADAHPFPAEATWTFTQHDPFNAVYNTNSRSAYLMVQRQLRHPFLALFDGADPNASTPQRQTTTVPTQALYFLNDPFFHEQANAIAATLMKLLDDESRTTHAYQVVLQRSPTLAEQDRLKAFIANYSGSQDEKWAAYVRVLLASNEFVHLD